MAEDYVPIEKLLPATDGAIYKLVLLSAKRAMMLAEGEKAMVEKRSEKLLDVVLEEIKEKKIKEKKGKTIALEKSEKGQPEEEKDNLEKKAATEEK